jgi:hypothetical protein
VHPKGCEYIVKNGKSINFWLDVWLDGSLLCVQYPILYDLAINKDNSIHSIAMAEWVVRFKVRLHGVIRDQWY